MVSLNDLHPEYIIDDKGKKVSIVIPVSDFQELIEDVEDLAAIAERRNESAISHEELIEELKKDGLI